MWDSKQTKTYRNALVSFNFKKYQINIIVFCSFKFFFSNFTENWAENKSKKLTWSTICFLLSNFGHLEFIWRFSIFGLVIKKLLSKSNWIQSSLFPCVPYIPWGQKSRFWLNSVKKFRIRGGVGGVGVTISRLKYNFLAVSNFGIPI